MLAILFLIYYKPLKYAKSLFAHAKRYQSEIFLIINKIKLTQNIMLGKQYSLSKDCCGTLVTKRQILNINLKSLGSASQSLTTIIPQNSLNEIYVAKHKQLLTNGRMYYNTYQDYCLCYDNPCRRHTLQIQINNEKVAETKIPNCCPHTGPFLVQGKQNEPIGELRPNCYICSACAELDVYDKSLNHIYKIKRQQSCFGGLKWWVYDNTGMNAKSSIQSTGWCCPNINVSLPDDKQVHKKLVLASLGFLP